MDLSLSGKRALVGGASAGIGRAVAIELAALGATVTLLARNEPALQETLSQMAGHPERGHRYHTVDFNDRIALQQTVEAVLREGPVHILVNNSGGPPGGPITTATAADFQQAFSNHLLCNHLLAQAVLPGMQAARYGRIINVISTSVKEPLPNLGVSNTTRWAVASWAKTLSGEVGRYGITVNNVLPGFTATGRLEEIIRSRSESTGKQPESIADDFKRQVPMERFAEPGEIAAAVAFLASPAAGYINGINLPVDGGRTKSL